MNELGWFCGNSENETHQTGGKIPNGWGLFDMSGNVWEMCWDRYGNYAGVPEIDPSGAESGSARTARGGSWRSGAQACRCANRIQNAPGVRSDGLGFRLGFELTKKCRLVIIIIYSVLTFIYFKYIRLVGILGTLFLEDSIGS